MKLERLNPHLGARISGLKLDQLTMADRGELRARLDEHQVLFFTGQSLDARAFHRFAAIVGELQAPDDAAPSLKTMEGDLKAIHYIDVEGTARGTYSDVWHSDVSFFEQPTLGAVLQPMVLPSLGGDTLWASMYAAYEALPDSLRRVADELSALHQVAYQGQAMQCVHPVVRVNPVTGRRGLYVNRLFTKGIVGMTPVESANLLELLLGHCTLPDFQLRFHWTPDIVAVWDNRFTMHYAVRDYSEPRRMMRVGLAGERPMGLADYAAAQRQTVAA